MNDEQLLIIFFSTILPIIFLCFCASPVGTILIFYMFYCNIRKFLVLLYTFIYLYYNYYVVYPKTFPYYPISDFVYVLVFISSYLNIFY